MAAASYYQLDPIKPQIADLQPISSTANAQSNSPPRTANLNSRPGYHRLPTAEHDHPYPTEPPSKPLVQSTIISNPSSEFSRLRQRKYQKWKRYLRILKLVTKVLTTIFAAVILALMLYVLITYYRIKPIMRSDRNAWPADAKVWPTYMFLAGALLTFILTVSSLLPYCWKKAEQSWKLIVLRYVIHIVAWIALSAVYRYEKGTNGKNNDFWGWSCAQVKGEVGEEFEGVVDFSTLCKGQSRSWEVSVAEVVIKLLFAVAHFVVYRKTMEGEKERLADQVGDGMAGFVHDMT